MDEFLRSINGRGSAIRSTEYYSDIAAMLKKLGLPHCCSCLYLQVKKGHAAECDRNKGPQPKNDEPTTEPTNMEPYRRQDQVRGEEGIPSVAQSCRFAATAVSADDVLCTAPLNDL